MGSGLSRSKAGSWSTVMAMLIGTDVLETNGAKSTQLTEKAWGLEDREETVAASKEVGA